MANEHASIEQVWREQPHGRQAMSLDEIRIKAREFERSVQQWRRVGGLTVALLIVKNVWEVWRDTDLVERAGDLMMLAALLYLVLRFVRYARANAPATRGQLSCLEHYRRQLVRQRELSRDGWKFVLPFVPGLGLIVAGRALEGRPPWQVALMIAVALSILAGVVWVIARGERRLEQEVAALDGE
jgi:hypothetical protein